MPCHAMPWPLCGVQDQHTRARRVSVPLCETQPCTVQDLAKARTAPALAAYSSQALGAVLHAAGAPYSILKEISAHAAHDDTETCAH